MGHAIQTEVTDSSSTTGMWKSALQHRWVQCPLEEAQKLFDRQPMVMETIVATQEGRTTFSIRDLPIRG